MNIISYLLFGPWERLRSIAMSMSVCGSVCLCVCLSVHEDISRTTHSIFTLYQIFCVCCLCLWFGPPPQHVYDRPCCNFSLSGNSAYSEKENRFFP